MVSEALKLRRRFGCNMPEYKRHRPKNKPLTKNQLKARRRSLKGK